MADFYLDKDVFLSAKKSLKEKSEELSNLYQNIEKSFETLRKDWDSEAGKGFFTHFEEDLIKNLKHHVVVFEHMSQNLLIASEMYDEVFRAADDVIDTEL